MKQTNRMISFLLILCILLLPACQKQDESTTTEAITKETEKPRENEEKNPFSDLISSLNDGDYSGRMFRIATDMPSLIMSTNSVSMVGKNLYLRNKAIEEKYNVKIALTDESGLPTITERIKSEALAGTDYCDLVILESKQFQSLAAADTLLNIRSIPYLDLNNPGIHPASLEATTMGNYSYGVCGDFTYSPQEVYAVFFNHTLLSQINQPNIYQLVRDNQWDFENFLLYSDELYSLGRVNGVRVRGYTSTASIDTLINIFWAASGERFVDSEYGKRPSLIYNHDATRTFISKAKDLLFQTVSFQNSPEGAVDLFLNQGSLFLIAPLSIAEEIATRGVNWGILPIPKLDINQKSYYSYQNKTSYVGVAKGSADTAFSGMIANAFFAVSKGLNTDIFLKTYLNLYLNSPQDTEFLNEVLTSPYYDFSEFYGPIENSVSAATQTLLYRVISSEGNFDSLYQQYDLLFNKYLDKKML